MSSAAARAEARKKAILSRGSDRLAKLTSSARGEEAATTFADPPLPRTGPSLGNFVGEESDMPTPPARLSPSPQRQQARAPTEIDPQQFLAALMGGTPPPGLAAGNNPFAAMLGTQSIPTAAPGKGPEVVKKSLVQKLLPLLHLAAMWVLLAYFVIWVEPSTHSEPLNVLERWGALLKGRPNELLGISIVPFFWAFTTLQIILHSLRIFSGFDNPNLPTLLAFVLPHLPPPFPVIITTALKYLQIGGSFLDDLAILIVGMGLCVSVGSFQSESVEKVD